MNPITHLLLSWPLANSVVGLTRRDRAVVVCSGLVPDLDGFGALIELATRNTETPLLWFSANHHLLAHNLPASLLAGALAAVLTRKASVAVLAVIAFHVHLLGDLVGSGGPDGSRWPIHYLWPFSSSPALEVSWQWALNSWPNVTITVLFLAFAFWFAWQTGRSPLGLVSERADAAFVAALRQRVRPAA